MSHSKKRSAEGQARKEEVDPTELDELEFEDPYGDDYEEDENEDKEGVDGVEQEDAGPSGSSAPEGPQQTVKQVWRSGVQKIEDIEDLEYDPSAYIMYHSMQTEWPCLSFDFIKDDLGDNRQRVSVFAIVSDRNHSRCYNFYIIVLAVSFDHVLGDWITSRQS